MPTESRTSTNRPGIVWLTPALAGIVVVTMAAGSASGWSGAAKAAVPQTTPANCVDIGTPTPAVVYTYQLTESTGGSSQTTRQWQAISPTGSRVRVTGRRGVEIQINEHHIVNDVAVIDRSTKTNAAGATIDATVFRPGIVGDPAFRACAGRSWPIPSVTAAYQSTGTKASAATPAGTMRIVALRERITVPAGTFETVRYVRTSQSVDEYWKSLEHGVIVKHVGTLPNAVVTEVLVSIK